jgi:hypothetical protein
MANYFSPQQVVYLLTQLKDIHTNRYPPELLAARRRIYLSLVMQLTLTRDTVNTRRKQFMYSIVREPMSTIIKALALVFIAFLIAFVAHSVATGNVNFEWLLKLLSR